MRKLYSKILDLKGFCIRYLGKRPKDRTERKELFMKYSRGEASLKRDARIEGHAEGNGAFAAPKSEFDTLKERQIDPGWLAKRPQCARWSQSNIVAHIIGMEYKGCSDLIVMHFEAEIQEVRKPGKKDAKGDPNWKAGGKTKNLITKTTTDGMTEVVVRPLPASRIKEVELLGHINYNI